MPWSAKWMYPPLGDPSTQKAWFSIQRLQHQALKLVLVPEPLTLELVAELTDGGGNWPAWKTDVTVPEGQSHPRPLKGGHVFQVARVACASLGEPCWFRDERVVGAVDELVQCQRQSAVLVAVSFRHTHRVGGGGIAWNSRGRD
eukprot:753278-Hanusia_phi.AAC.3